MTRNECGGFSDGKAMFSSVWVSSTIRQRTEADGSASGELRMTSDELRHLRRFPERTTRHRRRGWRPLPQRSRPRPAPRKRRISAAKATRSRQGGSEDTRKSAHICLETTANTPAPRHARGAMMRGGNSRTRSDARRGGSCSRANPPRGTPPHGGQRPP